VCEKREEQREGKEEGGKKENPPLLTETVPV